MIVLIASHLSNDLWSSLQVNSDISAYEVERTLDMESRVDLMKRAAEKKFPSYVSAVGSICVLFAARSWYS